MATSPDSGNNKLVGTSNADSINGLGGNDTITGLAGGDTLIGGTGHDEIDGGADNDQLRGDSGRDTLVGGSGHDKIDGGKDNDVLNGDNGNDTLIGGAGADKMTGGEGDDTYSVDHTGDSVIEIAVTKSGTDTVTSSIDYTLGANVENLTLTGSKGLKGSGNDEKNVITGNAGDNVLNGGKGNDTIEGNGGDDTINGGAGVDKLIGGAGSDVYVVNNDEDIITESPNADGDDEVQSSAAEYELNDNVERLTLLDGAQNGTGNDLDNTIDGNALGNELSGGDSGDDTINGNAGDDTLFGGTGNDELNGGDGSDVAVYLGSSDDYNWYSDDEGWIVEDITGEDGDDGVDEGIDTLTGIGVLRFSDQEVVIDDTDGGEPVLPTVQMKVAELSRNEGIKTTRVTVTLSEKSDQAVTVQYTTADGTAIAGSDYKASSGTLTFAPGTTSKIISVTTINDTLDELDETLTVQLSAPVNATLGARTATTITIVDNDNPVPVLPTLQLETVAANTTEGDTAAIKVTLSSAATQPVTVEYTTIDGSAQSGANDYTATKGTVTFAAGEMTQIINVATLDDTAVDPNETFSVQLSNPVNATLTAATAALVTIIDDTPQCVGTEADDNLTCSDENNDIDALSGNDTVNGMGGNDTLIGNMGDDVLSGGTGNDDLLGGEGNDVLRDSSGNDNMSGGLGDDRFVVDGTGTGTVLIEDTGGDDTLDASGAGNGVSINLTPGANSAVGGQKITLSKGGTVSDPLDMYFLEDLTGSFSDDVETVREMVPQVVTAIQSFQPDSMFGLGSFMDKPVSPLGDRGDGDYVYANNLDLTTDQAAFSTALNALVLGSGDDWPESQLEALMQVALRSDEIGFRNGAVKTVVLMTDADYHRAGDGRDAGITKPNNGDAVLDGTPAGTGEDYPAVAMVKVALEAAGILPIFAVTSDAKSSYVNLVEQLGFGSVVDLTRDSSNLVTVIKSGIKDLTVATVENAIGSAFNDTIVGDANANVLTGGAGVDTLTGGNGADRFVFNTGDSGVDAGARDIIKDFSTATAGEVIDLSTLSAEVLQFIGTADFAAAGQVRYFQDGTAKQTIVQVNLDDVVTTVEMEIELTGKLTLKADDFILT